MLGRCLDTETALWEESVLLTRSRRRGRFNPGSDARVSSDAVRRHVSEHAPRVSLEA